jgi:hypothetical protein
MANCVRFGLFAGKVSLLGRGCLPQPFGLHTRTRLRAPASPQHVGPSPASRHQPTLLTERSLQCCCARPLAGEDARRPPRRWVGGCFEGWGQGPAAGLGARPGCRPGDLKGRGLAQEGRGGGHTGSLCVRPAAPNVRGPCLHAASARRPTQEQAAPKAAPPSTALNWPPSRWPPPPPPRPQTPPHARTWPGLLYLLDLPPPPTPLWRAAAASAAGPDAHPSRPATRGPLEAAARAVAAQGPLPAWPAGPQGDPPVAPFIRTAQIKVLRVGPLEGQPALTREW